MTTLTNVSKQLVAVTDAGVMKDIRPGETVNVDGRQNWEDDLFVKAGWLKLSEPEPVKAEPEQVEPQETKPTRRKR
ncbi:MAG: hypothetical protein KKC55_17595 [Gammaproteobacteria bacterium]|uniref:Uncharacterized protein n=1 Tax=viral metagenome TaxID=1070528 RepID=A0A6M3M7E0_9ZZZZ|nr:hypothetical protein [Gammaproteobacteria bacterium]